jgi:predicted KAP-like P-loop ATPase
VPSALGEAFARREREGALSTAGITPDTPIEEFDQDRLDRGTFARALGKVLAAYDRSENLVVGLYGEWGLGKTSLLNLALKSLESSEPPPIVVYFNPWYFSDRENLVRQFFVGLSLAIGHQGKSKTYDRVSRLLKQLAKGVDALGDLGPAPLTKLISWLFHLVGKEYEKKAKDADSLDYIKSEISKALKHGRRRVVVVMDDLDRLPASEIRVVFQLVKGLADFEYTTYILAFDEQVVAKALKGVQKLDGSRYIEKIVNAPILVPPISPSKMRTLVYDTLNKFAEAHPRFHWGDADRAEAVMAFIRTHCRTMRHLTRLSNALYVGVQAIDGEVDGFDFVSVTALPLFLPPLYRLIRDNRDLFIDMTEVLINKKSRDETAREILDRFYGDTKLNEPAIELLRFLFPRLRRIHGDRSRADSSDTDEIAQRRERRLCDPDSFDAYFQFDVPSNDVSKSRMETILNRLNVEALRSELIGFIDESPEKGLAFLERLRDHTDDPRALANANAIVTVLFDLGDRFPHDLTRFPFKADGHTLILQVVYHLLRRVEPENQRYTILTMAIAAARESLDPWVTTISVEDQSHARYGSGEKLQPKPESQLVGDANLDILEAQARRKIEDEWANGDGGGRLAKHLRLTYVLYRWSEWGGHAAVEDHILKRLDIADFARLVAQLATNAGMPSDKPTLDHPNVRRLVDPDALRNRLRTIIYDGGSLTLVPAELVPTLNALAPYTSEGMVEPE